MKYVGSFGPSAPWMDDDEPLCLEDFKLTLDLAANVLASNLETRAAALRQNVTWDNVLTEIRSQISAASVANRMSAIIELTDLLSELQANQTEEIQEPQADEHPVQSSLSRWDDPDE